MSFQHITIGGITTRTAGMVITIATGGMTITTDIGGMVIITAIDTIDMGATTTGNGIVQTKLAIGSSVQKG